MESATYHTDTAPLAQRLFVLKKNDDKTVELGTESGVLVIGKCKVSKEPTVGQCVLDPVAPKAKGEEPKK